MKPARNSEQAPAKIVPVLLAGFLGYIERALRGNFHAVRMAQGGHAPLVSHNTPLVVYLNHASWWDPLVMMWLGARCYPGRPQFGPIDAAQLERYGFFKYLGVFGVEKGTVSGARTFLRTSRALLTQPGAMLWLTPQGRFADVRERPVNFATGLAHLAVREPDAMFVPLAIEYGFGQERYPEVILRFGPAISGRSLGANSAEVQASLEVGLESIQDALAAAACNREGTLFETLLQGRGGVSVPYDLWRRFKAMWNKEKAALNHSSCL
jgi:1-acyl-sn-glycerol-3-phosphate acyltransferase